MQFTFGAESLKVLNQSVENYFNKKLNLERSLRYGDRIHGHLVTGHTEALGQVEHAVTEGSSWLLQIRIPDSVQKNIWNKGSVALNGVSLTVNFVDGNKFGVCIIPETLRKTNLAEFSVGDFLNIETDYYAKVIYQKGV
jgi:riboflavin synthase